jgi:26S proteasome regulatory subunit N3
LLRNYLEYNLFDQADKLVMNSTFKEASTSNNQYARYLYYQGRIKAIQLEYSDSYKFLLQAVRKAPQASAKGFRSAAYKMLCIVQLLLGEIPERSIFRQPGLKKQLAPYLQLTQAVNVGNLDLFQKTLTTFGNTFKHDKTYTLIIRCVAILLTC